MTSPNSLGEVVRAGVPLPLSVVSEAGGAFLTLGVADTAYAAVIFAVGALSVGIAWFAWQRRETAGASPLAALMVGVTIWNVAKGLQILTPEDPLAYGLEFAVLAGVGIVVASFVGLVLEFTGRQHLLTRRTITLLAIEPVALLLAAVSNPYHELVWRDIDGISHGAIDLSAAAGPLFWVHTVYSFALLTAGVALLLAQFVRMQSLYRRQAGLVLLGTLAPMVANLLSLTGLMTVDLTPIGFAVTGIAVAVAISRDEFIDLVPIARECVVETLPDPVVILDDERRVTDVNPAARQMLRQTGTDVVGTTLAEAFSETPQLCDGVERVLSAADETHSIQPAGEYRRHGASEHTEIVENAPTETVQAHVGDGIHHYRLRAVSLLDRRGNEQGKLLVFHDVSDRERQRRELEIQNEQLERFASVVSHDLRNPLSVAEGYLELAQESGDEEHFEAVEDSFERMNAIIEDVLTLAREGARIEQREEISVGHVATTAWEQVDTGTATLEIEDDVTIAADSSRLQRLLENLFRNAVEHGPGDAERDLTVTVGPIAPEDGASVHDAGAFGFYVADDGVGIPEGEREGILEPGNSTAEGGTGLGLSIVQGIARAHGWSVSVTESATGGARFEFTGAAPVSHPASLDVGRGAER